ncbi:class I fructose-bisphosphate aldolase [Rickettsia endosymbiont of Cardiosporidium cionae]|uniref:class I fructose-bisphosphate aldolase n=1 Tax=Rickettsia endosymbiont of Cardiosporidium cionae TaxID=2777155 RepID=UPI0018942AA6|nr:class I fructose-bisphosphate aldolase [Rickettsia endosymbiont of Cardiosporidium cionae]KAF8818788.1 Fructose-bisphosphate aldolase class 1 [Rickettsia endosymbiont of Cardiosporidium cionae]
MKINNNIKNILSNYPRDNLSVIRNLYTVLNHGALSGTGKILILPVDQGFEHGADISFAMNPDSYDPNYHIKLAINARLNAYAAPLGMLEAVNDEYSLQIPRILKLNNSNALLPKILKNNQAKTSSVKDAVRLGCVGIGFTIYPGSNSSLDMLQEAKEVILEAKSLGMFTMLWSYPRGGDLSKLDETAIDVCAYSAHMACIIGAHIIKVKLPTSSVFKNDIKTVYQNENIKLNKLEDRVSHIIKNSFCGRRIVLFSGGATKSTDQILSEAYSIKLGGGNGSVIGRNSFQRSIQEGQNLLQEIIKVYKSD